MVLQSSMGQFKLDVRYGDRNTLPYYNGTLASTLLGRTSVATEATAGKVYTITTAGDLTVGITDQGQVPYFGWSGMDANNYPDVQRNRGMPGYLDKPADVGSYEGIGGPGSPGFPGIANRAIGSNIAGGFATIQHIAAAELATTAFVMDTTDNSFNALVGTTGVGIADYTPGTALTACATGGGGASTDKSASVGLLLPVGTNGGDTTDTVVGYVAPAGVYLGPEGYPVLAFTPAFVAGTTVSFVTGGDVTQGAAKNVGPLS